MSAGETPIDRTSLVRRKSKQVHCYLGELAVLMDVESGEYFEVNAVGTAVWRQLEQPMSVEELIQRLLAGFDVEASTCERDVCAWLEKMRELGFVAVGPA